MKLVLHLAFGLFCLGILGCLFAWVILAKRGSSRLVYQTTSAGVTPTWRAKLFRWVLILGLVVYMYSGTRIYFVWLPPSWRVPDDGGSLRDYLAGIVAFFFLIAIIDFLGHAARALFELRLERERAYFLGLIVKANGRVSALSEIKVELEKRIAEASDEFNREQKYIPRNYNSPNGQRMLLYMEVRDLLQQQ